MPTILIVDDSALIRSVVKIYLKGGLFEFLEASDGQRALAVLDQVKVDLVIVDFNMPVMNGLVFLEKVRSAATTMVRTIPVIFLTGDTDPDLVERATGAGADAFLTKPVSSAVLVETVRKLLPAS
jgi:two-component system chemotaxis response regulator CheY